MKRRKTKLAFLFFLAGILLSHSSCDFVNRILGKEDPSKPKIQTTHYPNGKVKSKITVVNGMKNGVSTTYYSNGKPKLAIEYKDDLREGLAKYYYQTGKIYRETPYVNDQPHGIQRKYYKTGELMAEVPFVQGKQAYGMKEYKMNGNVLTDYPEIEVRTVDNTLTNNTFTIHLSLTEGANYTQFYVDNFIFTRLKENFEKHEEFMIKDRDNELLLDGYYPVYSDKSLASITIDVPVGYRINDEVTFAASFQTRHNNTYLTYKTVQLRSR